MHPKENKFQRRGAGIAAGPAQGFIDPLAEAAHVRAYRRHPTRATGLPSALQTRLIYSEDGHWRPVCPWLSVASGPGRLPPTRAAH